MATFDEMIRQLVGLTKLPKGWDYGRGVPVSLGALRGCLYAAHALSHLDIVEFDITPGDGGSVTIFGYRDEESVEIQCFNNGLYDFLFEAPGLTGEILQNLTLSDLAKNLEHCGWRSPRFFVSCTRNVMSTKSADMPVMHLITRRAEAFPSLAGIALQEVAKTFALTLDNSMTNVFAVSRRSSGEFRQMPSQLVHA